MSMPTSLEIVSEFNKLLDGDKNYYGAASLLHQDKFQFKSMKANFNGKQDWLTNFPEFHKNAPIFEEPKAANDDDTKVTRKGYKKLGFIKINVMETYTIETSSGTIVEINAAITRV